MTRVFHASRERLWKEWTQPEPFADWYGGSGADIPLSTVSMDLRVGGGWRATMFVGPKRHEIQWKGEYREVVEPKLLVFTISDQPGEEEYELVTVVLIELGNGLTEMLFRQRGRLAPEAYGRARDGWSSFFERMAEHLIDA